jgi:hypothetical protein
LLLGWKKKEDLKKITKNYGIKARTGENISTHAESVKAKRRRRKES